MTTELLSALIAFAFVTSITPGPNNLMLMASGANFGWVRTIPHMLGVGIGFVIMAVLVGAGLIRIFEIWPLTYAALKIGSVLFLAWLAWKIAVKRAGCGWHPADLPAGSPVSMGKPQSLGDGIVRDQRLPPRG